MASTMLATLMVVAVWMGDAMASLQEASCNLKNIQTIPNFDLSRLEGTWYVTHRSHAPSVLQSVKLAYYTVHINGSLVIPYSYTVILSSGVCRVYNAEFLVDPDQPGLWKTYIFEGIVQNAYMLAVDDDYENVAVWDERIIDGARSTDLSTINLVVRDRAKLPNMEALAEGLRQFCGEKATSLSNYDHFDFDIYAECIQ